MLTKADNIPDELKTLEQWVCVWNNSKVPMRAWEPKAASSTNAKTWVDFNFAHSATAYDWCGFVFADNGYVGIDIDDGFDEDGFINKTSAEIISMCHSYTEISRSGRGFHILLRGDLPFEGANDRNGMEIYRTKRYFIITGNVLLYSDLCDNQAAIDQIVDKYFKVAALTKKSQKVKCRKNYSPSWHDAVADNRVKLRPTYPYVAAGSRNVSMLSLAGCLRNQGYDKGQILNELRIANKVACRPPLSDQEIQSICKSIMRYDK